MSENGANPEAGTNERERVFSLVEIEAGPIGGEYGAQVERWVDTFEPLEEFEAGVRAKFWLKANLETENLPHRTFLVFSDQDPQLLFGFFVLDSLDVHVSPGDVPIMRVRHPVNEPDTPVIKDPHAATQLATKLVWIARHKDSPAGIGAEMFEYALHVAEEAGSCALMVDAYDETTAQKLWIDRFDLRKPRAGATDWSCLWHTVGQADQTWG